MIEDVPGLHLTGQFALGKKRVHAMVRELIAEPYAEEKATEELTS